MKDAKVLLAHIAECIDENVEWTQSGPETFFNDSKTQSAVIRKLEVIGEAVRNIPVDVLAGQPEIPWNSVIAMRNRLIHGYFSVDLAVVWDTVQFSLPDIQLAVRQLLEEPH